MKPTRKFILTSITLGLFLCAFAVSGSAQAVRVTGFEPGDPAVSASGDAGNQSTFQGVAPPEGATHFLITTINENGSDGTDGISNQSGSNAVSGPSLQSFLGGGFTLIGSEGSGFIVSNVVVTAELNIITFGYDFLTSEFDNTFPDTAFAILRDSSGDVVGGVRIIAQPSDATLSLVAGPDDPFFFHTGYQSFELSVATPGTYSLAIGVVDRTNDQSPSGLLVDGVSVVPEPSTALLALAGVTLLVGLQRFRARR